MKHLNRVPAVLLFLIAVAGLAFLGIVGCRRSAFSGKNAATSSPDFLLIEARIFVQTWDGSSKRVGEPTRQQVPIALRFVAGNDSPVAVYLPGAQGGDFSVVFIPRLRSDGKYDITSLWLETRRGGQTTWNSSITRGSEPQPVELGQWFCRYSLGQGESGENPRYRETEIQLRIERAENVRPQSGVCVVGREQLHVTQNAMPERMVYGVAKTAETKE